MRVMHLCVCVFRSWLSSISVQVEIHPNGSLMSLFISMLLLALQDFRGAVSGASRQNGKPVIEERLLNQILYYLPQLYELNQDLLRELKQRVAKW